MIKVLILVGSVILVLFWVVGNMIIAYQEWLNEHDD